MILKDEEKDYSNKHIKSKLLPGQKKVNLYFSSTYIEELHQKQINRALTIMFIICEISFHIVENLFFINFIKSLNPAYQPSSHKLLSDQLIDVELSRINRQIDSELEYASNLTLGKSIFLIISIYNTS